MLKLIAKQAHVDDIENWEQQLAELNATMHEITGDDGTPIHLWFKGNELYAIISYTSHDDEMCNYWIAEWGNN